MNTRSVSLYGLTAVLAFSFGAFSLWLYEKAAAFDASGNQVTLKNKTMERKSNTLRDLTDAVLTGNLRDVNPTAERLKQYSLMIDGFLETDIYDRHGASYWKALEQLKAAAAADDWEAAKDATLAVERSCLECHQLLLPSQP